MMETMTDSVKNRHTLIDLEAYGPVKDWPTLLHQTATYSAGDLIHAAISLVDDESGDFADFVDTLKSNLGVIQAIARHPEARALGNDLLLKLKYPRLNAQVELPETGGKWDAMAAEKLVRNLKSPMETALWVVRHVKESLTVQDQRTWYVFDDGLWTAVPDGFALHYAWFRAIVAHLPAALTDVGFTQEQYKFITQAISTTSLGLARLKADKNPDDDHDTKVRQAESLLKALRNDLTLFDKGIIPILETELERIFPKVMEALKALSNMQTPGTAFDNALDIIVTPSYAINLVQAAERHQKALQEHEDLGYFSPDNFTLGASFVPRKSLSRRFLTRSAAIDPVISSGNPDETDYIQRLLWEKAPAFTSILKYQWATIDTDDFTDSSDDSEMWNQINALQRLLGYMVTGFQSAKCSVALIGPANTGKSTLTRAIARCFGDYCAQPDPSILIPKHGENVRPEDLMKIYGTRLAILAEVPVQKIDSGTWKALTGGDSITVRKLYQQAIDWKAQTKILIVGNNPPIMDNDAATKHRFIAIPFKRPIARADSRLEDRIAKEAPIIMRWVLEGALDWYYSTYMMDNDAQSAFNLPQEWLDYSTELIESVDPYHDFFTQWLVDTPKQQWESATRLYQLFEGWCQKTGNRVLSMTAFGRLMRSRDFEKLRGPLGSQYRCEILSENTEVSKVLREMRTP